ncbi:hypothetical protein PCE1_003623 [Barthelona sp. PCE]
MEPADITERQRTSSNVQHMPESSTSPTRKMQAITPADLVKSVHPPEEIERLRQMFPHILDKVEYPNAIHPRLREGWEDLDHAQQVDELVAYKRMLTTLRTNTKLFLPEDSSYVPRQRSRKKPPLPWAEKANNLLSSLVVKFPIVGPLMQSEIDEQRDNMPNFYTIVQKPITTIDIGENIQLANYKNWQSFVDDTTLLINNFILATQTNHMLNAEVLKMKEYFEECIEIENKTEQQAPPVVGWDSERVKKLFQEVKEHYSNESCPFTTDLRQFLLEVKKKSNQDNNAQLDFISLPHPVLQEIRNFLDEKKRIHYHDY